MLSVLKHNEVGVIFVKNTKATRTGLVKFTCNKIEMELNYN